MGPSSLSPSACEGERAVGEGGCAPLGAQTGKGALTFVVCRSPSSGTDLRAAAMHIYFFVGWLPSWRSSLHFVSAVLDIHPPSV
jgi:hypothetical protein